MRTTQLTTDDRQRDSRQYALRRGLGFWELTFQGRPAIFKHELGALYVACLLLDPPSEPIHAVALALKARDGAGHAAEAGELIQQRSLGLDDAEAVRALWRRQRALEAVLEDDQANEPVKAEALRELEEITEFLRKSPWRSRGGAERCVRAVIRAIKRFYARLAGAVEAGGQPHPVLRGFALHLHEYLLIPSGRGGGYARAQAVPGSTGCFTYEPPPGVIWSGDIAHDRSDTFCGPIQGDMKAKSKSRGQRPEGGAEKLKLGKQKAEIRGRKSEVRSPAERRPAAVEYVASLLCAWLALTLLATGCVGPRPLKGGRAVTAHKPAGAIEQTLVQGENPSQATKQTQESVKVRTYTVPAGSRMEQSQVWEGERPREPKLLRTTAEIRAREDARPPGRPPSTINAQPSTALVLSAPMPVVEREESRARTELGAAQKDTARELGAKLSSLKGIVWVGVGLFVFGLASLVWPPLKAVIGSVTTSAALMLGGVALMVLPSLVVGNELLILGGVGLAVGGWSLAHRHGELRGKWQAASGGGQVASVPASPGS